MQIIIQQAVLTEFRPVFLMMLFIGLIFLVLSFIPRGRRSNINLTTVLTVSIIQAILAGILLYTESGLARSFEIIADSMTLYLFVGILVLSIINPILFRSRNSGKKRYRYKY